MNYTKGDWKVTTHPPLSNLRIVVKKDDKPYNDDSIAMVEVSDEEKANANLIVSAVNACISVNPDNPQAVADSIKEMYEALRESLSYIETISNYRNIHPTDVIKQALAKAEGR